MHVLQNGSLGIASTRAVKSSSSSTRGFNASARASISRCFCPPERLVPRSETTVSSPSGNAAIKSSSSAVAIAFPISCSAALVLNAIFSRSVKLKIELSWNTKPTR